MFEKCLSAFDLWTKLSLEVDEIAFGMSLKVNMIIIYYICMFLIL